MKPLTLFLILLLLGICFCCDKWDLKPQEIYIKLDLNARPSVQGDTIIGQVELSAEIKDWQYAQISAHGFLWAREGETLSLSSFAGIEPLFVRNKADSNVFSSTITGLDPEVTYNFVAYATIEGQSYYSDVKQITTNTGQVFADSIVYKGGLQLKVYGHLSGTEQGLIAIQHGFCWASENQEPTLNDNVMHLGTRRDNKSFSIVIDGLEDGKSYSIRPFARFSFDLLQESEIIYGNTIYFSENLNFWQRAATWPGDEPRDFTPHFVIDGKLYYAGGLPYVMMEQNFLWKFDPNGTSLDHETMELLPGAWEKLDVRFPGNSTGIYGFAINGKGYMGGGYDGATEETDFYQYDPAQQTENQFTKVAPPPFVTTCGMNIKNGNRTGGCCFSINGKGYIGLGVLDFSECSGRPPLYDMWEFDPDGETVIGMDTLAGRWFHKADFPGEYLHITYPVCFVIKDKGYVTGGDNATHSYLFEFDPDGGETDPQSGRPMGKWAQKAPFPNGGRINSAGFAIGDKGYVGLGKRGWFRSGFWEYSQATDEWTVVADFPGPVRLNGLGFAIAGKGYIGFGLTPQGNKRSDFWVFDP